jgi:nucleoside-diphosphate-sugar epimerase
MGVVGSIETYETDETGLIYRPELNPNMTQVYSIESKGLCYIARFITGPVNIGSDQMVTINGLVDLIAGAASKHIGKHHIDGPTGVRGRNSDNRLIQQRLGWSPSWTLERGLSLTYQWVASQVQTESDRPLAV